MTILLLILKAVCIMAVAIAFACVVCMGLYAFLKHFGYFDTPAPSKTSEQMEEV